MKKRLFSMMTAFALVAGAMTSCQKDFTEDINKLQSDVNALSTQVSALDAQIKAGAVITSVTQSTSGVTVTLSNGQSFTITNGKDGVDGINGTNGTNGENGKDGEQGPAGTPGTVITIENGVWVIDGVPTEYKVSTKEVKVPFVNEDGLWVFYNEAGEEVVSNYRVTPVVAIENADGSYTLYVYDAEGNATEIKLPTAASAITGLTVTESDAALKFYKYEFTQPMKKTDWKGPRELPSANATDISYIVAGMTTIPVQVNPADLDITDVNFSLTNSNNGTPSNVTLKAAEYKKLLTKSYGNGLYTLSMEDVIFSGSNANTNEQKFEKQFKNNDGRNILYAVSAGNVRSAYAVEAKSVTTGLSISKIKFGSDVVATIGTSPSESYSASINTWYTVTVDNPAALYDMLLSVDNNMKTLYGIELVNNIDNWKFCFTKTPDNITMASFDLTVSTIDKNGSKKDTKIKVKQNDIIAGTIVADAVTYTIKGKNLDDEYFDIDMAVMKDTFSAEQLALWNTKVASTSYQIYEKYEKGKLKDEISSDVWPLLQPSLRKANGDVATSASAASKVRVNIKNDVAGIDKLYLDTEYYLQATFKTSEGTTLSSVIVPVTFTAPKLADLFEIKTGYVDPATGAINAYFYKISATTTPDKTVDLKKYFINSVPDVSVSLDEYTDVKTVGTTNYKSNQLGVVANSTSFNDATLKLNNSYMMPNDSQFEVGYGEILNVRVEKHNYANWPYDDSYDGYYFFTIRLASPIEQGTIKPVAGSSIVINGNDLVAGAKITDAMIKGYDYNNNVYNVVPDKVNQTVAEDPAWANTQIKDVKVDTDVNGYITSAEVKLATTSSSTTVNGYFEVKGNSISQTVDVNMPVKVTDAWGYTKTAEVPVTIKKN